MHNISQNSFAVLLEHRLRNCPCRTTDPTTADLFFVPILPKAKKSSEWSTACASLSPDKILKALQHLDPNTVCRHFFAIGKGHRISTCKGWWSEPIKDFKKMLRLSYSHASGSTRFHPYHIAPRRILKKDMKMYPNAFSVPSVTSIHLSVKDNPALLPQFRFLSHTPLTNSNNSIQEAKNNRPVLMSFLPETNDKDSVLRTYLQRYCQKNPTCTLFQSSQKAERIEALQSKSRSIFCLEPAGDTPQRQGIWDSLTLGCIPVLFAETNDDTSPWFWGDWKNRARVLIPTETFLDGCIDLQKLLGGMPESLVRLMQETIMNNMRKIQISIDDDPGDGIGIVLDNLFKEAKRLEADGRCGNK